MTSPQFHADANDVGHHIDGKQLVPAGGRFS